VWCVTGDDTLATGTSGRKSQFSGGLDGRINPSEILPKSFRNPSGGLYHTGTVSTIEDSVIARMLRNGGTRQKLPEGSEGLRKDYRKDLLLM
jgi:hypothetical protein